MTKSALLFLLHQPQAGILVAGDDQMGIRLKAVFRVQQRYDLVPRLQAQDVHVLPAADIHLGHGLSLPLPGSLDLQNGIFRR